MKSTVLASLEMDDGAACVDFFRREDGTFGFEQYRAQHDGAGRWLSLGRHGHRSFRSGQEALDAARRELPWLAGEPTWRW